MLKRFKTFIQQHQLLQAQDKLIIAVSGGKDSVTLCHLFKDAGYSFAIAHCNFLLRGKESDGDENFVKTLAKEYKVPYFNKQFQTTTYAKENGISIEMAARKLRYKWFDELLNTEGYQSIAVGHHLDDQVETVLNNLSRGTGISGLHGIRAKHKKLIRPLLFATREEIDAYATKQQLQCREDSSNLSMKHTRNIIRHQIIPVFNKINPSFSRNMQESIEHFTETEMILKEAVERNRKKVVQVKDKQVFILIDELQKLHPQKIYLYEYLCEYGFNSATVNNVFHSLDSNSGKQFFSPTHRLIKDREILIISKNDDSQNDLTTESFTIDASTTSIEQPIKLKLSRYTKEDFKLQKNNSIANLDADKLEFPLKIRKWIHGDYFYPFGMNKKKKLSDFFINKKFTLFEKENVWLLCSGEDIVWIIGHRIDNRFCIRENTNNILRIEALF